MRPSVSCTRADPATAIAVRQRFSSLGHWTLDIGRWTLGVGHWIFSGELPPIFHQHRAPFSGFLQENRHHASAGPLYRGLS